MGAAVTLLELHNERHTSTYWYLRSASVHGTASWTDVLQRVQRDAYGHIVLALLADVLESSGFFADDMGQGLMLGCHS